MQKFPCRALKYKNTIPIKIIGKVETNRKGGTTGIVVRPDSLEIMNGFPGPETFLPKGILYARRRGLGLTIQDKGMVLTMAEKYNFFLRASEVGSILRLSPKIREINHLAEKNKLTLQSKA